MLVKVLNACSFNQKFWVFYSAGTDVGLTVTVRDTETGRTRTYTNPVGTAARPVQDTAAFPCSAADLADAAESAARAGGAGPTRRAQAKLHDADVFFPTTAVGDTSIAPCHGLCYGTSPGDCDAAGTLVLQEPLAAPFGVTRLRRH